MCTGSVLHIFLIVKEYKHMYYLILKYLSCSTPLCTTEETHKSVWYQTTDQANAVVTKIIV